MSFTASRKRTADASSGRPAKRRTSALVSLSRARPANSTTAFCGHFPRRAMARIAASRPIWCFWMPMRPGSTSARVSGASCQRARASARSSAVGGRKKSTSSRL